MQYTPYKMVPLGIGGTEIFSQETMDISTHNQLGVPNRFELLRYKFFSRIRPDHDIRCAPTDASKILIFCQYASSELMVNVQDTVVGTFGGSKSAERI